MIIDIDRLTETEILPHYSKKSLFYKIPNNNKNNKGSKVTIVNPYRKPIFECEIQKKRSLKKYKRWFEFYNDKIIYYKIAVFNEIKIMRDITGNKNIMNFYETYETEHTIYLVLDLLEGGSLYDLLSVRKVLKENEIKCILKGILNALIFIHKKQIIHRDIKLENILFRKQFGIKLKKIVDYEKIDNLVEHYENNICLVDFGFAQYLDDKPFIYPKCGTPGYIAPEIFSYKPFTSEKYNQKCDVFSLGIVFHYLLLGKPAFYSKTKKEVYKLNKLCNINWNEKCYDKISQNGKFCFLK